jgi:hypothetical protein
MKYTELKPMPIPDTKAEKFVLIWLDLNINKNYDSVESEQKLRAIVNLLVTFDKIRDAIDFINRVQDQQIYLVVSGELAKKLLCNNEIVDFSKLNSVYIFCQNQLRYAELVKLSNKVRAVFVDIDALCARLKEDIEPTSKNLLPISTTSGTSADNENQEKFLCAQLHRDLLFTMEYSNNARSELADFCFEIYQSDKKQLDYIKELRTKYHAGKAISW